MSWEPTTQKCFNELRVCKLGDAPKQLFFKQTPTAFISQILVHVTPVISILLMTDTDTLRPSASIKESKLLNKCLLLFVMSSIGSVVSSNKANSKKTSYNHRIDGHTSFSGEVAWAAINRNKHNTKRLQLCNNAEEELQLLLWQLFQGFLVLPFPASYPEIFFCLSDVFWYISSPALMTNLAVCC